MSAENVEVGWNSEHKAYLCADGIKVNIKKQDTMKFTRKEQIGESWENKYDEILLAVGPRNGVVCRFQDGLL